MTIQTMATRTVDYKDLLLSFEGRINRQVYWMNYVLPYFAIYIVLFIIDSVLGLYGVLSGIFALAALYPSLAVAAKRWHDRDKSAWWILIVFVPVIGSIWFLIEVGFLRGTVGPNRFGEDPLAAGLP